jgi:hypothetical protein
MSKVSGSGNTAGSLDRQRQREGADQVGGPGAGEHPVDQVIDDRGDLRDKLLHPSRGERARDQLAQPGVLRGSRPSSDAAEMNSIPRFSRPGLAASARENRGSASTTRTCSKPVTSQPVVLPGKDVRNTGACLANASSSGAGSIGIADMGRG